MDDSLTLPTGYNFLFSFFFLPIYFICSVLVQDGILRKQGVGKVGAFFMGMYNMQNSQKLSYFY